MSRPFIYLVVNYGNIKQTRVEAKRLAELKPRLFDDQHSYEELNV